MPTGHRVQGGNEKLMTVNENLATSEKHAT